MLKTRMGYNRVNDSIWVKIALNRLNTELKIG